jgi:hypothetical protein
VDSAEEAETDPRALTLGTLLAALGPLLAAISSAAAYPAFAASERTLAAALALSAIEPPGHPLGAWTTRLCLLIPLGPLALRAALATALLFALAAAALFRAIERSLRAREGVRGSVSAPLALALTLLAFGCTPLLPVTARADAAAIALACLCVERLVHIERAWPRLDLPALRCAALLFGLLAPEHPTLACVVLAAALPLLQRLVAAFRLPLANLWPLALGLPVWLALAWAAQHGPPALMPGALRPLLRAAFALARDADGFTLRELSSASSALVLLPYALTVLGLLGAALALRPSQPRRIWNVWIGLGLAALLAAHLFQEGAAHTALGLCAAAALSAYALSSLVAGQRAWLGTVAALALTALAVTQLEAAARKARAIDRAAIDALGEPARRDAPARSALLLAADSAPALLEAEAEEHARPDLLVTLKPWLLDLAAAQRVAAQSPELLPLLRADLLGDETPDDTEAELPVVELAALAARRPLLLELTALRERSVHRNLTPFALYHQVATSEVSKSDVDLAAQASEKRFARAFAEIVPAQLDPALLEWLADRHLAELDYALSLSDLKLAAQALERLDRLPLTFAERNARVAPFAAAARTLGLDLASFKPPPRP